MKIEIELKHDVTHETVRKILGEVSEIAANTGRGGISEIKIRYD